MKDFSLEVPNEKFGNYLVFAFDGFESYGGLNDCKGYFNDSKELRNLLEENNDYDHYQILNVVTGCKVNFSYSSDSMEEDFSLLSERIFNMLNYVVDVGA